MNDVILDNKLDCLLLTETWLGAGKPEQLNNMPKNVLRVGWNCRVGSVGLSLPVLCFNTLPCNLIQFHYMNNELLQPYKG